MEIIISNPESTIVLASHESTISVSDTQVEEVKLQDINTETIIPITYDTIVLK